MKNQTFSQDDRLKSSQLALLQTPWKPNQKKKKICKFKENGDNSIRFFQAAEYVISRPRKLSSKWELKKADKQAGLLKHTQKIHKLLSPSALKRGEVRDENWKTDRNSI